MSTENNIYECPRGCKAQGGKPIAASIRGWKKHMTRQHGGYDEAELAAIVGAVPPDAERGREQFLSEAESQQDTSQTTGKIEGEAQSSESGRPASPNTVNIKKEQMARKFSARMNKFKEKLAARLTQGINLIAIDKSPDWALNEDDEKLFAESLENCFEILDIDFQIRPVQKTLENPLWVLALPLVALLMIFLPKIMKAAMQKDKEDENVAA